MRRGCSAGPAQPCPSRRALLCPVPVLCPGSFGSPCNPGSPWSGSFGAVRVVHPGVLWDAVLADRS